MFLKSKLFDLSRILGVCEDYEYFWFQRNEVLSLTLKLTGSTVFHTYFFESLGGTMTSLSVSHTPSPIYNHKPFGWENEVAEVNHDWRPELDKPCRSGLYVTQSLLTSLGGQSVSYWMELLGWIKGNPKWFGPRHPITVNAANVTT